MYNSDISPVTQRRVWSATNHRKWQSGLRWYNKQVQITLMNIRERGVAGGGVGLSICREKDSSEWAKSIKYSSSHFCTLSSANNKWSLKGTLVGGRRRNTVGTGLCCPSASLPQSSLWPGERARRAFCCEGPQTPAPENAIDGELRSEEPWGEVPPGWRGGENGWAKAVELTWHLIEWDGILWDSDFPERASS